MQACQMLQEADVQSVWKLSVWKLDHENKTTEGDLTVSEPKEGQQILFLGTICLVHKKTKKQGGEPLK